MVYHTTYLPSTKHLTTDDMYGTFRDLPAIVCAATYVIRPHLADFDFIAVQGVSGMSVGFPLALSLKTDIVVVRKANEESHWGLGDLSVGVPVDGKRGLFVDDFVSGGRTRQRVSEEVEKRGGRVVAQYMARENEYQLL